MRVFSSLRCVCEERKIHAPRSDNGTVLALIGLGLKSASSAGEDLLPAMSEAIPGVPAGFDRVITAFWNESLVGAGIFMIALVAVLGVSMIPDVKVALSRMNALVVTVLGVLMLVVGGLAAQGAQSDADSLEEAFAGAMAAGMTTELFTVSISVGWYLLAIGGVVAAIGGVLALVARPDESALTE